MLTCAALFPSAHFKYHKSRPNMLHKKADENTISFQTTRLFVWAERRVSHVRWSKAILQCCRLRQGRDPLSSRCSYPPSSCVFIVKLHPCCDASLDTENWWPLAQDFSSRCSQARSMTERFILLKHVTCSRMFDRFFCNVNKMLRFLSMILHYPVSSS